MIRAEFLFLQRTPGLLLEYNVRSAPIARQIDRLATHFDLPVQTMVGYRSVTLLVANGCLHVSMPERQAGVTVHVGGCPPVQHSQRRPSGSP
jgi:hypothetical protein